MLYQVTNPQRLRQSRCRRRITGAHARTPRDGGRFCASSAAIRHEGNVHMLSIAHQNGCDCPRRVTQCSNTSNWPFHARSVLDREAVQGVDSHVEKTLVGTVPIFPLNRWTSRASPRHSPCQAFIQSCLPWPLQPFALITLVSRHVCLSSRLNQVVL